MKSRSWQRKSYLPEIKCANHKAFLQQTSDHSQDHRIVVAATKDRIRMGDYSPSSGMSILGRVRQYCFEVFRVVYAAIQWGVISERWNCKTVRRLRHEVLRRALQAYVST
jgi:hypothetical protein